MLKSFDGVKVGDKLRCTSEPFDTGSIKVGDVVEVTDIWPGVAGRLGIDTEEACISSINANCFELVKEKDAVKFDMKTQPWFIRIESEEQFKAVDDWLLVNFGQRVDLPYYGGVSFLTNASKSGRIYDEFIYVSDAEYAPDGCKEIKLSFKTTVDLASLPEVETPEQVEIKRLTKIIEDAQENLAKLSNP